MIVYAADNSQLVLVKYKYNYGKKFLVLWEQQHNSSWLKVYGLADLIMDSLYSYNMTVKFNT